MITSIIEIGAMACISQHRSCTETCGRRVYFSSVCDFHTTTSVGVGATTLISVSRAWFYSRFKAETGSRWRSSWNSATR